MEYSYGIIKSSKGILKLRRRQKGDTSTQKVISLGVKVGDIKEHLPAEIWAKSILLQHETGELNLFEGMARKPLNKAVTPSKVENQTLDERCDVVFEKCYKWIRLHLSQDDRNESLGIINRSRSDTVKTYVSRFRTFADYVHYQLGPKACMGQLKDIAFFEGWADELRRQGQSTSTISGKVSTVQSVFKQMRIFETYGISDEAFRSFANSKRVKKSILKRVNSNEFLTTDEIAKVTQGWQSFKIAPMVVQKNLKYEPLFSFLLWSGCRVNIEALQIQLKEIDWEGKRVFLKICWEDKENPSDWLQLNHKALDALRRQVDLCDIYNPESFVFGNINYFNFHSFMKTYLKRWLPGKKSNPHMLRHTFATQLLSKGATLWEVSNLLRHKNLKMVESHYGHLELKRQRAVLDLL